MSFRQIAFLSAVFLSTLASQAMAGEAGRFCHWNNVRTDERELKFAFDPNLSDEALSAGQPLFSKAQLLDTRIAPNPIRIYCYISKNQKPRDLAVDCFDSRFPGANLVAKMHFAMAEGQMRLESGDPVFALIAQNGEEMAPEKLMCGEIVSTPKGFDGWLLRKAMQMGLFGGTCI